MSSYGNLVNIVYVDMDLWRFTKVMWSYSHDVSSIFQISLKQITASESYHCPNLVTAIRVDMGSHCFPKITWSYCIFTISTLQVSLNLLGVFYLFVFPTSVALALVERELMAFSQSHMILQLKYYDYLSN